MDLKKCFILKYNVDRIGTVRFVIPKIYAYFLLKGSEKNQEYRQT